MSCVLSVVYNQPGSNVRLIRIRQMACFKCSKMVFLHVLHALHGVNLYRLKLIHTDLLYNAVLPTAGAPIHRLVCIIHIDLSDLANRFFSTMKHMKSMKGAALDALQVRNNDWIAIFSK